jgi:hypothetical protein
MAGETVRIDYEVLTDNQAQVDQVIHLLKQAIWADPRFDYQGSKIIDVGNVELGRDIKVLSIYATLRKTQRESRLPIEYASLSTFEAYIKASAVVWSETVAYIKTEIVAFGDWLQKVAESLPGTARNVSWALLLIAGILAYTWFFGLPKRSH